MTELTFNDEAARNQNLISETAQFVRERLITLERLGLQPGDRVLDLGFGTGHMLQDISHAMHQQVHIDGIDISEDMLALAQARCANLPNVTLTQGDLYALPFPDGTFDVVYSVQVFEYLEDVEKALAEAARVLKPGGRLLIRDADWSSLIWNGSDEALTQRVLQAWDLHLVEPNIMRGLSHKVKKAGFDTPLVTGFISNDTSFDPTQSSFYIAKFVAPFVEQNGVSPKDSARWLADLQTLSDEGRYFYAFSGFILTAVKRS